MCDHGHIFGRSTRRCQLEPAHALLCLNLLMLIKQQHIERYETRMSCSMKSMEASEIIVMLYSSRSGSSMPFALMANVP